MNGITLWLPERLLQVIDYLVQSGIYTSRSSAIRSMLMRQIDSHR